MINLLFGGNDKVLDGITLCLLSAAKHTTEPLNVYVMTTDLTELNPAYRPIPEEACANLEKMLQSKNPENQLHRVQLGQEFRDWILSFKDKRYAYTPFTFLRLFLNQIENVPSKILYLDADIMINGDLKTLFDEDLTGYEMGVVLDRYGRFFINPHHFNAGMLLINVDEIKRTNLFEKAKELCRTKKLFLCDQSALNRLVTKVKYLPRKFNEQGDLRADTVVQHFSKRFSFWPWFHFINIKPWHVDQVHSVRKCHVYDDIYAEWKK